MVRSSLPKLRTHDIAAHGRACTQAFNGFALTLNGSAADMAQATQTLQNLPEVRAWPASDSDVRSIVGSCSNGATCCRGVHHEAILPQGDTLPVWHAHSRCCISGIVRKC